MLQDRYTRIIVRLDNILHNYNEIKKTLKDKEIVVVVKADAYGHGVKNVAKYLYDNGVNYFAVSTLEEALELRSVVKDCFILVLGVICPKNINFAINENISLCCPSVSWLEEVITELKKLKKKLNIHLKIDSGMSRIGINNEKDAKIINEMLKYEYINLEGIFTHYANSDDKNDSYDDYQKEQYKKIAQHIKIIPKYIHHENSAATLKNIDVSNEQFNLARVGIAIYGEYPSEDIKKITNIKLKNVSSLVSKVVHIKKVNAYSKIGYGCTYESKNDEYIATVPIGYRDGLIRASQGYKVIINGEYCEIVGRVCMDQIMIRCSKNVKLNDVVLFYGEYENYKLSVNDYAKYLDTISYEVYCIMGSRIPRKYYIGDKEVENL